jgi:hypothetical protein
VFFLLTKIKSCNQSQCRKILQNDKNNIYVNNTYMYYAKSKKILGDENGRNNNSCRWVL